jgi:hypothetical protein
LAQPGLAGCRGDFVALFGLAVVWLRPSVPDRFTHYRETMVSAAVREYVMDVVTKDRASCAILSPRTGLRLITPSPRDSPTWQLKGGGFALAR